MTPPRPLTIAVLVVAWLSSADAMADEPLKPIEILVKAGSLARKDTPVEVPLVGIPPHTDQERPIALLEVRDGKAGGESIPAQVVRQVEHALGSVGAVELLRFVLSGETPAGRERRFRLSSSGAVKASWEWVSETKGVLELKNRGRTVFCYNTAPVGNKDFPKVPPRDAYIHPAYSPSGALLTGDFSKAHPHHRGIFFAYTKTAHGKAHPDFWNIQNGTGLIVFETLEGAEAGPVSASFVARHRWEAKGDGVALRETWRVEVIDIPGAPYWLFDLTIVQQSEGKPLELPAYRYGGMAYRGPDPFLTGKLDVLTSEGHDRQSGDQKPARWVDLTGPVAEGSTRYGGALVMDHPSNPHHPTPARIHPTTLPFLAFTPSHDTPLTIPADRPTVFRYRFVLHDGRPGQALDERLWQDFAHPPEASVVRKGP